MFEKTQNKLEDCHNLLDQLEKANNGSLFRSLFNSFINSSRGVTNALQKEGKRVPGFSDWYAIKQEEMKQDELLKFLHNARTEDFHEGKHRLSFTMSIGLIRANDFGNPPSPDSKLTISGDGPYWIMHPGTPRERRIPATGKGGYQLEVSLNNPPSTHLGKQIIINDPVTICKIADLYFTNLIAETLEKFKSASSEIDPSI